MLPGWVVLSATAVQTRWAAGRRVTVTMPDPHAVARTWRDIRELLDATELDPLVRRSDQVVFETLARAEARVHGIEINEVHFHEIGVLDDSIADIAGRWAAVYDPAST